MIRIMYRRGIDDSRRASNSEVHPEVQDSEAGLQRHRTGPSKMVVVSLSAI